MSRDTSQPNRHGTGNFFLEAIILAIKGVVIGLGWLLVSNWRVTFPLHVVLGLLALAAVINSEAVTQGWTALLIVAMFAGIIVTLVSTMGAFRENRLFGYVSAGLGSAWVLSTRFTDLDAETLFQGLIILLLVFGIFWAMDHRGTTTVKLRDTMRSWHSDPERQKRAGVEGLTIIEHEETDWGWRRRCSWVGNQNSVEGVIKQTRALETEWGELENSMTVERVPASDGSGRFLSNEVEIRCIREDPLSKPLVWDGQTVDDLTAKVQVGTYADGRPLYFQLWENGVGGFHTLCAGATRSGKSVLMVLWALLYGGHPAVRCIFVDLKGGAAFQPVAPMGSWLTVDRNTALNLLELLNIECDRRAGLIARKGWPGGVLKYSAEFPIILAFFDEIASLTGDGIPREIRNRALFLFSEIARKGAGIGILLKVATQEPTKEALGSMQFVTQLAWRAGFRLNQPGRQQYSIPGLSRKGVDPYNIRETMKGTAYVDHGVASRAMEARMLYIPDWLIKRTVLDYWHHEIKGVSREIPGFDLAVLPPGSTITEEKHNHALQTYAARTRWTPELAYASNPHEFDDANDEPTYAVPDVSEAFYKDGLKPIYADDEEALRDPPEDRDPFGYQAMEENVTATLDAGEMTCEELVELAASFPTSSPDAKNYSIAALEAALREGDQVRGMRRKQLMDRVNRKASWVSQELAKLREQGRAHSVGPVGDAYWFHGPETPHDTPKELES